MLKLEVSDENQKQKTTLRFKRPLPVWRKNALSKTNARTAQLGCHPRCQHTNWHKCSQRSPRDYRNLWSTTKKSFFILTLGVFLVNTGFGTNGIVNLQQQLANVDKALAAGVGKDSKIIIANYERWSNAAPIQNDLFVLQFNP